MLRDYLGPVILAIVLIQWGPINVQLPGMPHVRVKQLPEAVFRDPKLDLTVRRSNRYHPTQSPGEQPDAEHGCVGVLRTASIWGLGCLKLKRRECSFGFDQCHELSIMPCQLRELVSHLASAGPLSVRY